VPACLPVEHDILTGSPRGFVTGLFFASFFVISILHPRHIGYLLLNTAMAVTGYFINPNSIFISAPLLFYFFLINYRNPRYYVTVLAGIILSAALYFIFDWFYVVHPERILIPMDLSFHPEDIWNNLAHLDEKFAHVSFFRAGKSIFLLLAIFIIGALLIRRNRKAGFAYLLFLALILLSFCFRKNIKGSVWPFFSYSRMYVTIPLALALFTAMLQIKPGPVIALIAAVSMAAGVYKTATTRSTVIHQTQEEPFRYISLVPLRTALDAIHLYGDACRKNHCSHLLISTRFWLNSILNYGGPATDPSFPLTRETIAERRYLVRNDTKCIERFVFISALYEFDKVNKNDGFILTRLDDYGMFLVTNNTLTMPEFIRNANIVETSE
jgi:hypothetical protein